MIQNPTQPTDFYRDGGKPNVVMTGGGNVTYDTSGNLLWDARFIIIGGGASTNGSVYSTSGFYDITIPPVGTVISALGSASPVTVTAAGISLTQWGALYYKLSGGSNSIINSNFIYVGYGTNNFTVTPDMVLVAAVNAETKTIRLGTGQIMAYGDKISLGKFQVNNYATTAAAIADATLLTGAFYTVTTGGAKQLFVK